MTCPSPSYEYKNIPWGTALRRTGRPGASFFPVRSRRPFPTVSELQGRVDGVDVAVRESTCGDGIVPRRAHRCGEEGRV
jgi:hypothetical protein